MEADADDVYRCYMCQVSSGRADTILTHTITTHMVTRPFSIRKKTFDETTGRTVYQSIHFSVSIDDLRQKCANGFVPHINDEAKKISYKRKSEIPLTLPVETAVTKTIGTQTENSEIFRLMPTVIENMEEIGRLQDLEGVFKALSSSDLMENIAFHLLLDVGRFYTLSSIDLMRYPETTLQFWTTVKHLFKGKGLSFFRGYKGQGLNESSSSITPQECRINFVVPADRILSKECSNVIEDARQTGILHTSLDSFAKCNTGNDVKLSIDGKKLATGLGKQGDEDLCGYEKHPSLQERKQQHAEETQRLENVSKVLEEKSLDGCSSLLEVQTPDLANIKEALLLTISNLSEKIKELRELIVIRNISLQNLMKQVEEEDWRKSKVAPAISFNKTKIVHATAAIKDLLDSVDNIGYIVACINGTENSYIRGQGLEVDLNQQPNYTCLRESLENTETEPFVTKQRSTRWHSLRDKSGLTGSTMFKALGMETLKDQRAHHDKVFEGKTAPVSPELQKLFDYGTNQEINALATLIGKIIPVYYPSLAFREDGCEVVSIGQSYMVVSGDGSGVDPAGKSHVAFELKSPFPGKQRTTDLHYKLPTRYTTQVLSQMAVKHCEEFGYVCYNQGSSSFITGSYDDNLWKELVDIASSLYGSESSPRPVKIFDNQRKVLKKLKEYTAHCSFVAEFPSLVGKGCSCPPAKDSDFFGTHQPNRDASNSHHSQTMDCDAAILDSSLAALREAYQILRKPAKEILVTVISDLERTSRATDMSYHAVPVQYALPGYSLTMTPVRNLLKDVIEEVYRRNLHVKVVAFDGQFLEIAVANEDGGPLTVCRFMKQFWEEVQKTSKASKLATLLEMNELPGIKSGEDLDRVFNVEREGESCNISLKEREIKCIPSPRNIAMALRDKRTAKNTMNQVQDMPDEIDISAEVDVLSYLPKEVVDQLDGTTISLLQNAKGSIPVGSESVEQDLEMEANDGDHFVELETVLVGLIASQENSKWETTSLEEFMMLFKNADTIKSSFLVAELKTILSISGYAQLRPNMRKAQLVNIVCSKYGDGSIVKTTTSPKTLKTLAKDAVKRWSIEGLNVAYAQLKFKDAFEAWDSKNEFQGHCVIETDTGHVYKIPMWYAQPSNISGRPIQTIIDPHHIFVNNRARCCSKGMFGMNIKSEAWWSVAEEVKQNGTGLSLEIAK